MAGIADVQPKSIGQVSLPVMAPVVQPGPAGSGVSETLPQAFEAYSNMFNTIKNKPLIDLQRQNNMQQAQITQQNAPAIGQAVQAGANLSTASSLQQQANLNGADAEQAFFRYNANPMLGRDGQPDHVAIRQAGMNYLRAERMFTYAQQGLTPQAPIDIPQNGQMVKVYQNAFRENVFDPDVQDKYQEIRHEASKILMGPPVVDTTTPGKLSVADKNNPPASTDIPKYAPPADTSGIVAPDAPVTSVPIAPDAITPLTVTPASNQPVLPPEVAPAMARVAQLTGSQQSNTLFDPNAAVAAYRAQTGGPPVAAPVVLPNSLPGQPESAAVPFTPGRPATTTISTDNTGKPVISIDHGNPSLPLVQTPAGVGIRSGPLPGFEPQNIVKTARETKQMQGWSNVGDVIKEFKSLAASNPETTKGPNAVTTQNDISLANTLIRLQNPTGTGRGFSDFHVTNLEKDAPIFEQLTHIKNLALKNEAFTPETRARLITEGNRLVESVEGPARDQVRLATGQLQRGGYDPAQYLDGGELGLLQTGGGASASGGAALGPRIQTLDGRSVRMKLPVAGGQ